MCTEQVPEGAVSAKFLIRLQTDNGSQVIATGEVLCGCYPVCCHYAGHITLLCYVPHSADSLRLRLPCAPNKRSSRSCPWHRALTSMILVSPRYTTALLSCRLFPDAPHALQLCVVLTKFSGSSSFSSRTSPLRRATTTSSRQHSVVHCLLAMLTSRTSFYVLFLLFSLFFSSFFLVTFFSFVLRILFMTDVGRSARKGSVVRRSPAGITVLFVCSV